MRDYHIDEMNILKNKYKEVFNQLHLDEEKTIEFYYKLGIARGVDAFEYINEAINRASMKQNIKKPISYIASLCKQFYKNGLYSQPSDGEHFILDYIQKKIGSINDTNINLIQASISTNGATKVMAATAEVLNSSKIQDKIIEEILLKMVDNM